MEISRGKKSGAQKVILYAPEGWGKSTAASKMPDTVFIDAEGSTKMLDVARIEADYSDWNNILKAVDYINEESPGACKTLVIDTIDWVEQACINRLNEKHHTDNVLTLDYGKGSQFVHAEFGKLLIRLDKLIEKGVNVVLLAHALMRKQELPEEMGAFDRWELKLQSKQVKAQLKEWADAVLFGNYKTIVVKDTKTKSNKAQGGKRVIYTTHAATWDAKNRHDMPEVMDLDYDELNRYLFSATRTVPETRENAKNERETSENAEKPSKTAPKTSKTASEKPPKQQRGPDLGTSFTPEQIRERAEKTKSLDIDPELKALMLRDNVADWDIQGAVSTLKNCPYAAITPITEYSAEFVKNTLVNKWDGVLRRIKKINTEMEVPFGD